MNVIGITMIRDEADILPATLGQMLRNVDHVIVADNGSTDGTREYLDSLADERVTVLDEPRVGYFQSERMTELARRAAEMGAEWVVPWDADEWWYSGEPIADILTAHPGAIVTAAIYDHVATALDPDEPDPTKRLGWRRWAPCPLHKVACRTALRPTIDQGNHGATYPTQAPLNDKLVIRHFPYRSPEQFERKVRNGAEAYAATDLPDEVGGHWRGYGRILNSEGPEGLERVFRKWFWRDAPAEKLVIDGETQRPLVFDPAP